MRAGGLVKGGFLRSHLALAARVARNSGRLFLTGRPVLRSIDMAVSAECPLSCTQCYARAYTANGRPVLSAREVADIIGQADRLGAIIVQFNGGEPLTRSDLGDLVSAVPRGRMCSSLTTSGLGLDAARLRALVDAGLDFLVLSIDHPDAAAHDAARGRPGLFDNALAMARLARSLGLGVIINTIAGEEALLGDGAERMVDLARSLGVQLNLITPVPPGGGGVPSEAAAAKRQVILDQPDVRWCGDSNYRGGGCGAGREKLSISPFGDVYACALFQIPAGSVREEPLGAIWRRISAGSATTPASCGDPRGGCR